MIPDNEDDLDEVIEEVTSALGGPNLFSLGEEVIKEVCCEEDKTKIKKHMLIIIHLIILIIGCFKCCTKNATEMEF